MEESERVELERDRWKMDMEMEGTGFERVPGWKPRRGERKKLRG